MAEDQEGQTVPVPPTHSPLTPWPQAHCPQAPRGAQARLTLPASPLGCPGQ